MTTPLSTKYSPPPLNPPPVTTPRILSVEDADARREKIELIRRTHQIFNGIQKKEIALRHCQAPGRTDVESFIAIPFDDDECDLVHKHEWQHIFFKTDLHSRERFVTKYRKQILAGIATSQWEALTPQIDLFLHSFCNAVDDIRVASLWHKAYPQSAEDIENRWRRIIIDVRNPAQDLIYYTMGKGLGLTSRQIGASRWDQYEGLILKEIESVREAGFPRALLVARNILDGILAEILPDLTTPPPQPRDALAVSSETGTTKRLGAPKSFNRPEKPEQKGEESREKKDETGAPKTTPEEAKRQEELSKILDAALGSVSDVRITDTQAIPAIDPNPGVTATIVSAVMGELMPGHSETIFRNADLEMARVIKTLRAQPKRMSESELLLRGFEDHSNIIKVRPEDVDELVLEPEDELLVQKMRRTFVRLMDRKRRARSDEGVALDPMAYFELIHGSGDADIFEDEVDTRGFSALIMADMSGSMIGESWDAAARATKCLARAMKFPFSCFEVWGFSARASKAHLFRFMDPERGYTGSGLSLAWGSTPLHIATTVAIRRAEKLPGSVRHVFIVTDGMPTPIGQGQNRRDRDLAAEIGDVVVAGRRRGLHITGLLIGDGVPDEEASKMFGTHRAWARCDTSTINQSLVPLVEKAFVGYLKGK